MTAELRIDANAVPAPRVSVIVRSTDRPTLAAALASIGAQDHPRIEIIVVAASGAGHRAPPERAGEHPIRFVAGTEPLSRPRAANAGVDAAQGEWLTFLDDDDVLLPGHVSGLVAAQARAADARFVYSLALARMASGRTQIWGQPFSLQELYERNFIHLATALFSRELLALGCRFDESLDIMQDWDFFLQCAQHTRFHFEPRRTFEWHAELGTSGAAAGPNHDPARFAAFRDMIYSKWNARRDALIDRVRAALADAVASARRGDHDAARAACRAVLDYSQNDPYALNVLAMVERAAGRIAQAREAQELACSVRPEDASLVYNLALLCRMQGDLTGAIANCRRATRTAPSFAPAQELLAELQAH